MKLDAIVFDLDDTLFDTTRFLLPAADRRTAAALRAGGVRLTEEEIIERLAAARAAGDAAAIATVARAAGADHDISAAAVRAFFAYADAVPPLTLDPRVTQALDELVLMAPLALLTTGDPPTQERKIERLGLAKWFLHRHVVDYRARGGKFEALGAMLAAKGWRSDHVVMVGDRPDGDVRAGNRCGCRTVLVRRPGAEFSAVSSSGIEDAPWRVVAHVAELPTLLREA